MAEATTLIANPQHPGDELPESLPPTPAEDKSPFRRIEFHLARKPFTGFSKGGGGGSFRLETLNPTASSSDNSKNQQKDGSANAMSGKKRDASELENGFDPELSFGITFRRIGAGLENLGNTCFLNSVLQCLTYTEPLAAYLQSGKHQITCRNAGFCALCAIQKHVSRALQASGRSLAPKDLVSNLRCISRTFRNSRQEDAHEYMVNLLESMHKCCLPSGVPSESPSAYERSLVHKIFGGRLRSQVKCMQCNYCSNKFDPFLDLSLEILKAETLYRAFQNFTAKEQLDGGARQYQCQQCKQKVKALKQLTIHKAPNVLTIHLKRFGSHISGQKIDKKIHFGPTLDLKDFVTGPYDGDLKYTLYGVLVHAGWSTHSGHYYCFVRTSSGMWYALDDNQVFPVGEKKVFEQKAYMLFYFRDRKNPPSKKPATDVAHQKEKMVINSMERNNTRPIVNDGTRRDTVPSNGIPHPSEAAVAAQRDASGTTAPKETQTNSTMNNRTLEGAPSTSTPMASDSKEDVKKISSESLLEGSVEERSQNDAVKMPSVFLETEKACAPSANISVQKVHDPHKQNDAMEVEGSTKNNVGNAITIPSISNSHQNPTIDQETKLSSILPECKENNSSNGNISGPTDVMNPCSKPLKAPEDAGCITRKSSSDKVGETSQEVAGSELFGASGVEDSQKGAVTLVSTETSNLQTLESSLTTKKALDRKTRKKMKKKHLKYELTSMKFCFKFVVGAALNQRKKKKHKRGKRGKLRSKDLSLETLMDVESIPMDEGPSSSNKISPQTEVKPPTLSGKLNPIAAKLSKGVNAGSKIENRDGGVSVNPVESELKSRVDKDVAVLATSVERNSSSVSAGSQSELKEPNASSGCKRTATQKELLQMLTRGLDDSVPRWDDDGSKSSVLRETKGDLIIGYVGDEWDEEYDRGKRKKVRSSSTRFDGGNPFQDIANERIKARAAGEDKQFKKRSTSQNKQSKKHFNKKDKRFKRSNSGNRPFRI